MENQGEWQVVTRRRRYPDNWREKDNLLMQPTAATRPFVPFSHTFAQAVAMPASNPNQPKPKTLPTSSPKTSTTSSVPSLPSSSTYRQPTKTYISPHSHTALRFPPSPLFAEWRGRCFRCCRTGHAAASCRFLTKCGKCWADGHVGSRCKKENTNQSLNPAAKPFSPSIVKGGSGLEPSFDSLLTGAYPLVPPVMPESRSLMHTCFVERDAEYYSELERLKSAIVVHTSDPLDTERIADNIASSGLVQARELCFASLSRGRYLVHLPNRLAADTVISAIPAKAWEKGLSFQQWSPLEFASIDIPNYTLIINILDVEPHLYREKMMIRATSGIGVYLGTVAQADASNIATWTAVIATDNLERVPPAVSIRVGGLQFTMPIKVLKVSPGPIYSPQDIPVMPLKHKMPETKEIIAQEEEGNHFTCSRAVLQDLCMGRDQQSFSSEIKEMLAGAKQPRLSKDDLITLLLHQKIQGIAAVDHLPITTGQSEANLGHETEDHVTLPVPTFNEDFASERSLSQIHQPHGIPCVGESSGTFLEGVTRVPDSDVITYNRRVSAKDRTLKEAKANKGMRRGQEKAKPNSNKSSNLRPIPMKKAVNRVDPKTRYGLLHRKPHGKGLLHPSAHAPKSKGNQEGHGAPLSRDFPLRRGGRHSNLSVSHEQSRDQSQAIPTILKRKSAQVDNGPPRTEFETGNDLGPKEGIDLQLNPEGFYSVHVTYDRAITLAHGCGLKESDVDDTVIEENHYLRHATNLDQDFETEQNAQNDGERVCTDPITSDDEETETD